MFTHSVCVLTDHRVKGARDWFKILETHTTKMELQKLREGNTKVKIGILDTGINLQNPMVTFAGRVSCWPDQKSCHDSDGHGTHVAYLINRIAPHAQLHVARISTSRSFNTTKIKELAELIAEVTNMVFFGPSERTNACLDHIAFLIRRQQGRHLEPVFRLFFF